MSKASCLFCLTVITDVSEVAATHELTTYLVTPTKFHGCVPGLDLLY